MSTQSMLGMEKVKSLYGAGEMHSIPYVSIKGPTPCLKAPYCVVCFTTGSDHDIEIEWPNRFLPEQWLSVKSDIFDYLEQDIEINTRTCRQVHLAEINSLKPLHS